MDTRTKVKKKIEEFINKGDIENAKVLLEEYYKIGKKDFEYYGLNGIINIMEKKYIDAIHMFKQGLIYNNDDFDLNYNLGFIYENLMDYNKAYWHYSQCKNKNENINLDIISKLNEIEPLKSSNYKSYEKKIVFFVKKGMDNFLSDIIEKLSEEFNVLKLIVTDYSQIDLGMQWGDICWFEWCDELLVYGSKVQMSRGKKIICRLHRYEAFTDYLKNVNWDRVDKVIFVSEHIRDIVIQKVNLPNDRGEIIYNGINLNTFKYFKRDKGFNLAWIGYLNLRKNPMLVIQYLNELVKKDKRYNLSIAGTFQDETLSYYLKDIIERLNLNENITFDGFIPNNKLEEWLKDKHYIITGSIAEGHPVGVMEAMATGIKPIIHYFPGCEKFYPSKYTYKELDEFVKRIDEDDYNSEEYREFIRENFSLDLQFKKIFELIQSMTQNEAVRCEDTKGIKSENLQKYLSGENFSSSLKIYIENNNFEVIDRMAYLVELCRGKKVIHLGCADHLELISSKRKNNMWLHDLLTNASEQCIGFDINKKAVEYINRDLGINNVFYEDIIKNPSNRMYNSEWDIMVMGEILEHVDNPVEFLSTIKKLYKGYLKRLAITIPNALRLENYIFSQKGYECINSDHRYWFTPYTISKVIHEAGLEVEEILMTTGYKIEDENTRTVLKNNNIFMDTIIAIAKV